jgi:hypothetical protein
LRALKEGSFIAATDLLHLRERNLKMNRERRTLIGRQPAVALALLLAFVSFVTAAHAQEPRVQPGVVAGPEAADVSETGKKLANPLSNVWALFTEFDSNFSDGKLNGGHQEAGSRMIFQPILPIPLFGSEGEEWKLITRPTIPFLFSEPIPIARTVFDRKGGLGDIQLPMIISPTVKNWILGAGSTWLFPSATEKAFGRRQWGAGPAVVVGHYSEKVTLGVFSSVFLRNQVAGPRQQRPRRELYESTLLHVLQSAECLANRF